MNEGRMAQAIGETLRDAREEQGLSLSDAAAETRVRESYLAALESEDFAILGGDVYVKGFLRSYAKYLGLEPDPLVASYNERYEAADDIPTFASTVKPAMPGPSVRAPQVGVLVALGVVLVAALAVLGIITSPDDDVALDPGPPPASASDGEVGESVEPQAETPEATATDLDEPLGDAGVVEDPSPDESDSPSVADEGLDAESLEEPFDIAIAVQDADSWLEVTVDSVQQVQDLVQPGGAFSFDDAETAVVQAGDAAQVTVSVDGVDLGALGGDNDVVELRCEVGAGCERETLIAAEG